MTSQSPYRLAPGQTESHVRSMLRDMAHRLETNRPDARFTAVGRIAIIQATTMSPPLARALRARAPEIATPTTRAAYAAVLREIAGAE
ncbi:hypothetical protein AB0F46_21665 [Streptomyces sp. NPDC026665]|uniref:hypothetical protein n=1 Tax=Streptomyces sp. NPDC026665 TaxID=3154798 RepID=UPI0033D501CD